MDRIEYVAIEMTERTGIQWKPVQVAGIDRSYIISQSGDVFNIKKRCYIKAETCHSSRVYFRLRSDKRQRTFQLDELMLNAFPEQYESGDAQQWRQIMWKNEPTEYEVSETGTVRRINNHHIVKPVAHKCGYYVIRFRHAGKTITEYAHRLVAAAFIPNPNGYEIVNHKDENRHNNAVNNLEWCDRSYNMLYNGASKRAAIHGAITRARNARVRKG